MPPIVRSPELQPLSREHHRMLLLALRVQHGVDGRAFAGAATDVDGLLAEVEAAWAETIESHAAAEDRLLTATLAESCGVNARLVQRMSEEHETLRGHMLRARETEDDAARAEALRDFGVLLETHVRFEDRELFGLFEAALPAEELARIGVVLAEREAELAASCSLGG